jgi:hypothetical protein
MVTEKPIIFEYSSQDAINDGIFLDIREINDKWQDGLFSFITTNLLETHQYIVDDKINIVNLSELLSQCFLIVKKKSNNFKEFDHFFSGFIETPNGEKVKVFMCQNELGKFTIMLPEDY